VTGGPAVGEAFSHMSFDRIIYTGSTKVGRHVMRAAADNLTPITLELGGKSPVVVADDADLPKAVASIMFGKLLNAGQTCIAPDYVLVPPAMKDEFTRLAQAAIAKMYPRLEANPDYTSIVDERHYRRLKSYVDEARAAGATVVEVNPANEPLDPAHRKMAPTLVIDPGENLKVMQEEIFGPILPIKTYDSLDEAIDYINRRPRPLALYFFGKDTAKRDMVLGRTTSGGASVNETLMHFMVENLPFGGVGPSGMGAYHGKAGFDTFSHQKGVFLQSRINGTFLLRPPFGKIADFMLNFLLHK